MVCLWHVLFFHSIPQMLCLQSDPPVHTSFPSVHAFIMLEGTMNLTGETQPLVEQLMMIKRMQVTSDTSVHTSDEVVCVCSFPNVFFPPLFIAYPSFTVCAGDLEGLFHWAHWISRGEWGTEMDSFHLSKGVFESPITLELWIVILSMVKESLPQNKNYILIY